MGYCTDPRHRREAIDRPNIHDRGGESILHVCTAQRSILQFPIPEIHPPGEGNPHAYMTCLLFQQAEYFFISFLGCGGRVRFRRDPFV